jgi:predicted NBD/HSP70 family sugar kinase
LLIANVHLLLDLELVLVSGGLASAGDELQTGLQTAFQRICPQENKLDLRIELGALPVDTAGVIGASCLWFEKNGFLQTL